MFYKLHLTEGPETDFLLSLDSNEEYPSLLTRMASATMLPAHPKQGD